MADGTSTRCDRAAVGPRTRRLLFSLRKDALRTRCGSGARGQIEIGEGPTLVEGVPGYRLVVRLRLRLPSLRLPSLRLPSLRLPSLRLLRRVRRLLLLLATIAFAL